VKAVSKTQIDRLGDRLRKGNVAEADLRLLDLYRFDEVTIIDRRERPSYGYRAVHVLVASYGKVIEIQVRTSLQHLWAELSEKLSDVVDPAIKYGGGEERIREVLARASDSVVFVESEEKQLADILAKAPPKDQLPDDRRLEIAVHDARTSRYRQELTELLTHLIASIEKR
jgi:ppGpp synthetase/RelA/SpoT-type nucleotidyltranferase